MFDLLASADNVALISILVKTLAYAATLIAAGSALVLIGLRSLPTAETRALRRIAIIAALVAAIDTSLRLPVRASFLMGGTWDGAFDPGILLMVTQSPLGASVLVRLIGLALILALFFAARWGRWAAALGALMASASFALRGHALGEPQMILAILITVHILGLAFWLGVFAPLYRLSKEGSLAEAGAVAEEFGTKATWVVGLLVLAGALTLWLLGAITPLALASPYGQFFLTKLALFIAVMGFAAANKVRLGPALAARAPGAGTRMRRSLALEAGLILAILLTTAALTTLSSPPGETGASAMLAERLRLA